jgi:hypothetical protein
MFQSSSKTDSYNAIYGSGRRSPAANILDAATVETTRWLFGPTVSPRQVLERHTLFGAYSRVMTPYVAGALTDQLVAGNNSRFRWFFHGHRGRKNPSLATAFMRSCKKCIEDDIDLQGFASWRVLHQLPTIAHCPQHGQPLHDEGKARAEVSRNLPLRLPGEQASKATKVKTTNLPMSDGYAAYLHLWTEAFEGDLTGIAPGQWMLVMDAVVRHFGTIAHANEQVTTTIQKLWDAPLSAVTEAIGIADGANFVQAELEQRIQASYLASRLVICGALDALKLSPPRLQSTPWQSPLDLGPMMPFGSWLTPQTQAELAAAVMDANFPPALFRALAEDLDIFKLDARLRIDRYVIRKFAMTLPDELLYRMSMEQSWDRSSWLMKELRRREVSWSISGSGESAGRGEACRFKATWVGHDCRLAAADPACLLGRQTPPL